MALGLNISIARLGSVWNSNTVPEYYQNHGLGFALMVGFIICCFSLLNGVGMAFLDKYAESKNPSGEKAALGDDDKFKWKDLYAFSMSFWLLTISCVVPYMSIFPYLQIVSDLV
jgi:hypothetical protein